MPFLEGYLNYLNLILCEIRLNEWEKASTFANIVVEKIREWKDVKDDEMKLVEQLSENLSEACIGILKRESKKVEESLKSLKKIQSKLKDEVYYAWVNGWLYEGFVECAIKTIEEVKV